MHRKPTGNRSRTRLRVRKSLALLTGGLLAAATLALGATPGAAAGPPAPAAADAAAEEFQQVTLDRKSVV